MDKYMMAEYAYKNGYDTGYQDAIKDNIKEEHSKREEAYWIGYYVKDEDGNISDFYYKCSECRLDKIHSIEDYNFCPRCGKVMTFVDSPIS